MEGDKVEGKRREGGPSEGLSRQETQNQTSIGGGPSAETGGNMGVVGHEPSGFVEWCDITLRDKKQTERVIRYS